MIIEVDQDDHWRWLLKMIKMIIGDDPVLRMTKSTFFDEIGSSDNFCIRQLKVKSFINENLILSMQYRGKHETLR